ncbi:MAG: hypothetical protein SRB2_03587 [Desulfobacteraceae bacterium Eth-SRB2]|nr:MAG: hypothetical protein SRB2_03587 [Desulfobacteraceae bacterium Eth-SRB2]
MIQIGSEPEIRKWFENPDTKRIIEDVAGALYPLLKTRKIFLAIYSPGELISKNREDIVNDVTAELVLFILENVSHIQQRLMAAGQGGARYLKTAFLNHCKDKSRSLKTNRFKYLYKRAADILRNSEKFNTIARQPDISCFSISPESRQIPPLTQEDYGNIPFPEQETNLAFNKINSKDRILKLAHHFLIHLSQIHGNTPVRVDLRDFIQWIGLHVDLTDPIMDRIEPSNRTTYSESHGENDDKIPDSIHRPDRLYENLHFNQDLVMKWAENFSNRLTQKEKLLFYLRYGEKLSLEQIADKSGYKGPSGPEYQFDKIENKLRYFLRDLPWLSPGEGQETNEEAFTLFLKTLLKTLKSSIQKP